MISNKIVFGDCRVTLRKWAEAGVRVQTCVTSPPYFGLRDYGHEKQIGLEKNADAYINAMVSVFNLVRSVLAEDGTLWLNLGDSYGAGKQLLGIPWRTALALQADGWYLRQDIVWHKPNPMPESVRDRCTKAHEYIFLLSKQARYYFDSDAVREPYSEGSYSADAIAKAGKAGGNRPLGNNFNKQARHETGKSTPATRAERAALLNPLGRNRRSVWTVATKPYSGAHFATYPPALIEPCILAGSRQGDIVLDPFMGSGTTAEVALLNQRLVLGCELNRDYKPLIQERVSRAMRLTNTLL